MLLSEVINIATEAIQKKLVVEVDYNRKEDGILTCRIMEPFDVAARSDSEISENKLLGWCLFHNRIEKKPVENITSMKITNMPFDPKIRESTLIALPKYQIPRNW